MHRLLCLLGSLLCLACQPSSETSTFLTQQHYHQEVQAVLLKGAKQTIVKAEEDAQKRFYQRDFIPVMQSIQNYASARIDSLDLLFPNASINSATELLQYLTETRQQLLKRHSDLVALAESRPIKGVKFDPIAIEHLTKNLALEAWSLSDLEENPAFAVPNTIRQQLLLTQLQTNIQNSANQLLQHLHQNMGRSFLFPGSPFNLLSYNHSPAVRLGVPYRTYLGLGYYGIYGLNFTVKVNGKPLALRDHIAYFEETAQTLGTKSYVVEMSIQRPGSTKLEYLVDTFQYEVIP